jgi:hypothetical protein
VIGASVTSCSVQPKDNDVSNPPPGVTYSPVQYVSGPLTFEAVGEGSPRQPVAVYDTGDGFRIDFNQPTGAYHLEQQTGFRDWASAGIWTRTLPVIRDNPTAPTWSTLAVDFDANTQIFSISMPDGAASRFHITGPLAMAPKGNG